MSGQEHIVLDAAKQGLFKEAFGEHMREQIGRHLTCCVEYELTEQLGAERHERTATRRGFRNGSYRREVLTSFGLLAVRRPKVREGGFSSAVLSQYKRRLEDFDAAVVSLYVAGCSDRETTAALYEVLGAAVSHTVVARLVRELHSDAEAFHRRSLEDDYLYLLLDGMSIKQMIAPACWLKGAREGESVLEKTILLVMGVRASGERELIDYCLADSESEANWEAFLADLFERGLQGRGVSLFVHDGLGTITQALNTVYGERAIGRQQRCVFHKLNNLWQHTERKDLHEAILPEAAEIWKAPTREQARKRIDEFAPAWRRKEPRAVKDFLEQIDDTLRFYDCPVEHRSWVMCSNPLERYIRELRRRTRTMGVFQSRRSVDTLIYVAVHKLSDTRRDAIPFSLWASQRHRHRPFKHKRRHQTRTWNNVETWKEDLDDYIRLIRSRGPTTQKKFTPRS